jgi:hypothetical protein
VWFGVGLVAASVSFAAPERGRRERLLGVLPRAGKTGIRDA